MKLDYHGDSIVEPRGNVRIQTQTPAQGILSAIAIYRQLWECFACSRSRTEKIKSSSGMAIMEM